MPLLLGLGDVARVRLVVVHVHADEVRGSLLHALRGLHGPVERRAPCVLHRRAPMLRFMLLGLSPVVKAHQAAHGSAGDDDARHDNEGDRHRRLDDLLGR